MKMSLTDEFIRIVPPNELKTALKFTLAFQESFQILKNKGYLRLNLRGDAERAKFIDIMKTSNRLFSSYNMLFQVFSERGKSTKFVKHNKEFGFNEDDTAHLFLSESITMLLRSMELFKNCFLFILKTRKKRGKNGFWSRMTLGPLINQLVKETEGKIEPVTRDIDKDLRNSLAHCLFWLDGTVLIYYKDLTLKKRHEIIVTELWTKGRKHSLIAQCLIHVIADWFSGT